MAQLELGQQALTVVRWGTCGGRCGVAADQCALYVEHAGAKFGVVLPMLGPWQQLEFVAGDSVARAMFLAEQRVHLRGQGFVEVQQLEALVPEQPAITQPKPEQGQHARQKHSAS